VVSVNMRIVAVEEHFNFPDLLGGIDLATLDRNGWPAPGTATFNAINSPELADTGRERIADSGHSLAEIALLTGFADQSDFTRRFRHHAGCTPAVFAREQGPRRPERRFLRTN
jgi:AraC-like DNA-binding protein